MEVRKIHCSHMLCTSNGFMLINEKLGDDYEYNAW